MIVLNLYVPHYGEFDCKSKKLTVGRNYLNLYYVSTTDLSQIQNQLKVLFTKLKVLSIVIRY